MAIETICQGCAQKLRVADEHAGKQARCPGCGSIYTVPAATQGSSLSVFDKPRKTEELPSRASDPLPARGGDPPSSRSAGFANPPPKEVPERWFMKIDDGREFGPVDRATLDQWYRERRIGPTTQLKREYDSYWQPARNVYPALATVSTSPTPGGPNPFADNPYSTPGYTPQPARNYSEPHRGALILVLAIVGWVTGCFFTGLAAWMMGMADLKKMESGQMDPSGEGLTRAGMIIGAINGILGLLWVAFMMFVFLMIAIGG